MYSIFRKRVFFQSYSANRCKYSACYIRQMKKLLLSDCFFIYLYICYLAFLVKNIDLYICVSYCLRLYIFSTLSFKLSDRQIYERFWTCLGNTVKGCLRLRRFYERFWTCCSRCNAVNQRLFGSYLFVKESVSKMPGSQLFEVKNS